MFIYETLACYSLFLLPDIAIVCYLSRSIASGVRHQMSNLEDSHTNTDSSSDSNNISPFDGQLPQPASLTYTETIDLWSHAILFFHNLEWEQALSTHCRILRQCAPEVRKGFLWFNVGVIRATLGEYYLAAEAFAKALKYEPECAVGWYCLGISLFELDAFRGAKKVFDRCLRSFGVEETVDYSEQGLDFVLEKTRVEWNCRQALLEKNYNKARAPLVLDRHLGINSMPAGTLFEPPSFGDDEQFDGDVIDTASPETSERAQPTPSSSLKLRQGLQTLLRRQPKQSTTFEHSNPRLQALDDEVSASSEPRKETLMSILAPTTAHRSPSAPLHTPNSGSQPTSPNGEDKIKFSNSSTWPRSAKPPPSLPFVTTTDLSTVNTAPHVPPRSAARTRAGTLPQKPAISQGQGSPGVVYHEGSIVSTEYIPTPPNPATFPPPAPTTHDRNPPSRHTHPSDIPAPLSIRRTPHHHPTPPTLPSPTSIYSRPFHSPPHPANNNLSNPKPKPKPTTAATQTWLDDTFPPPRWDSLPAHLRPPRRPSRHRSPRHQDRRQPLSLPVNASSSARVAEDRHLSPPTSFPNSFYNEDPNYLRDAAPRHPADRQRDSTATMESFAIVGMGRGAAGRDDGDGGETGGEEVIGRSEDGRQSRRDGKGKGREKVKSRWLGMGSRRDR